VAGIVFRGVIAGICLLPPTMLMGATLPAIARTRGAHTIGLLYMANLAGGATGTVLAGFYLLRVYDTVIATGVAVAVNIVVAASFYFLARPEAIESPLEPLEQMEPVERASAAIYVTAALSGFTALGAEVVWTRQLSLLFGASVYTFSLILAVFLAGLGIGGLVGTRLARRTPPAAALGWIQALLAGAIAFGAYAIVNVLPHWQPTALFLPHVRATPWMTFTYDALRCGFALLPATILWGASFPLTLAAGRGADFGGHVARINAINTAGALAGAIAFTLIGIPKLGSHDAQQALVIGATASSLLLLLAIPDRAKAIRLGVIAAITAMALWIVPPVPGRLIAYGRSVNSWDSIARFLYLGEGATASIAVTEGKGGAKQFHIAGKVEASDMDIDMRLERMLGHIPALLHPHPKSVLIVGVGAGVTAGALSIHPEIERIVICDIEPLVPISARAYFGKENHHVFDNPKVQLVFDDARHFLQTTDEKFDIITSDPIHPWVRGAATLYSEEYLTLSKNHLTPGGVATQWIPLYETDERSVKSEIGTFAKVFPDTTLWNPDLLEEGYDLVALGRAEQTPIVEGTLQARIDAAPRVKQSLDQVMLKSAGDILGTYAGRGRDLAPWLAGAEINRERHLRLQYLAGLAANTDHRFAIFGGILAYRRYPADLFVASADTEARLRDWYTNAPPEGGTRQR
jgi:spermidine synthase